MFEVGMNLRKTGELSLLFIHVNGFSFVIKCQNYDINEAHF